MAVPLNVPVHCRLHIAPSCFLTPGMVIACPLSLNLIYYFLIAEKYFSVPGSQYKLEIQPSDQESQVISFLTPDHLRSFSWLVWHLSLWYLLHLGRSYENRLSKSARLKNKPWFHHLVMFDLEQTICSCNKSVFPGVRGEYYGNSVYILYALWRLTTCMYVCVHIHQLVASTWEHKNW